MSNDAAINDRREPDLNLMIPAKGITHKIARAVDRKCVKGNDLFTIVVVKKFGQKPIHTVGEYVKDYLNKRYSLELKVYYYSLNSLVGIVQKKPAIDHLEIVDAREANKNDLSFLTGKDEIVATSDFRRILILDRTRTELIEANVWPKQPTISAQNEVIVTFEDDDILKEDTL